jgi:carbon-monoxide dehydrogenase medium subunit
VQVPAPFEYERATSVAHAVTLLGRLGPDARVIAGGHSLLPMMKLRLAHPEFLIDINDLRDELDFIHIDGGEIRIGALTRHRALLESDELFAVCPIFRDAEQRIADPPVRNRGTIGGALCQADPAEDLSSVCSTLDASCVIQGPDGRRVVPMERFYQGPYLTDVGPGEMLVEVRIPLRPGGSSAYEKVDRRAGDWAIVAVGAALWLRKGVVDAARVGLAAVGPNTICIPEAADALAGRRPDEESFALAGRIASESCSPRTDARGTEAYKRHLVAELTVRTLRRAAGRLGVEVGR